MMPPSLDFNLSQKDELQFQESFADMRRIQTSLAVFKFQKNEHRTELSHPKGRAESFERMSDQFDLCT